MGIVYLIFQKENFKKINIFSEVGIIYLQLLIESALVNHFDNQLGVNDG